jgi:hypothetical protein
VIFLAQQAVAEMEMAAVPAAHFAGRSGSWLSGRRLAWIPAAALATVVGLAFLVHGRHEATGKEMARAVPPVAPQNEASIANPPANNRVDERKVQSPVSPIVAKQPEIKVASAPVASQPILEKAGPSRTATNEAISLTAAPPGLEPPETVTSTGSAGQIIGMSQYKPEPIPAARLSQSVGAMYSSNSTAARSPEAKMDERSDRDQASRKAEARYAGSGGASTSQLKKNVMPHSSSDAGAQLPVVQFEASRQANIAPLPSRLAAVSSVTAENRTLAIDQAGALFLSGDSGNHWESIARQWTGRAVDVSLLPALDGRLFVAAPTNGAAAAPVAAAEIFELRNDKNLTWVSTDGTIWTAQ